MFGVNSTMTNGTQPKAGPLTPMAGSMRTGFTLSAGVPGRPVSGQPPVPPGDASRGVKNGLGSPADADVFLGCEPVGQPGAGARPGRVTHCCREHADQNFGFP